MNRRSAIQRAAATVVAFSTADAVFAQQEPWRPSRPITMFVPGAPGSGVDILARELGDRLGAVLKQQVIVENKPGGSGAIATKAAVRAPADGQALLYTNAGNTVMAASLVKTLPYDVLHDLVPVAQTVSGGIFLLSSNDFPAKNLTELVRYVKANPGKFSYGTSGIGSVGHLTMEWLKRKTGMDIAHVPYRQAPQLLTELAAGTLKLGWIDPAAPLAFIETHKVRPIAVTGATRLPHSPSVPTMGEQGYPFETVGWFGVFAPKGTPAQIVQTLAGEINRIQAQPDMVARITSLNVSPPTVNTPEQFGRVVTADFQTWKRIVADAGIKLDN
jgi:tripartite-type tricarboxylate transporter receptor subunit TctC